MKFLDEDVSFGNVELHYGGMPEWNPKDITECYHELEVEFEDEESLFDFSEKLDLNLTLKTKSRFYPQKEPTDYASLVLTSDLPYEQRCVKYPVYVVSKNRWNNRLTSNCLVNMGVKHYIVVEESQYNDYFNATINDREFVEILTLDQRYLDEYDTFDELGDTKSKGPGAARNFAWDHSISLGANRHWVMDDNSEDFAIMFSNMRYRTSEPLNIRIMEDFVDRYENVYIAGPNYYSFAKPTRTLPAYVANTRIYSCLLIQNDIPYRWGGRYNEDTDLSLRVLKDGGCTIQFNQFLFMKVTTQRMSGGNTEEFYKNEGTNPKSQMLVDMHPDVARLSDKFNRDHHHVDYSMFKYNIPKLVGEAVYNGVDNYGIMVNGTKIEQVDS